MGISRQEQETIISFNAEEDTATIWASDPSWIRKMDKLVDSNPDEFKCTRQEEMDGQVIQKRYEMPKKYVSIRSKSRKREMTEEQKKINAERLREARNKKSSQT